MASERASIVDTWLEDDNLMLIEAWARDYSKKEVAERIGINISTLREWDKRYPEIHRALSVGREIIDYKVENALLKRALGYTAKEIKVVLGRQIKGGQTFQITKEVVEKEIAPDVTACAIWLNNRRPDKWKRNRDKVVEVEEQDSNLQITIVRGPKTNDELDSTNQEITISAKEKSDGQTPAQSSKSAAIKEEEDDQDYWPDDWEDEDE